MGYKLFPILVTLVVLGSGTQAQTLKQWTWDTYKLKFQAPDDLELKRNEDSIFEAGNNNLYLDIYPRRGESLSYDDMKSQIVDWAYGLGLKYPAVNASGTAQPIYLSNLNGFWGCAIDGQSNNVPATVLLLVNPDDPSLRFYIWINYTQPYYQEAIAVLKSFTPIPLSGTNAPVTQKKTTVKHTKKKSSSPTSIF